MDFRRSVTSAIAIQGGVVRMAPSPTRPLWGWTPVTRLWLSIAGTLSAVVLIVLGAGDASQRSAPHAPRLVVDPNTAPPAVLSALPHLGPAMVKRIVAAREMAPFRSLGDLDTRVRGIGPATVESLRPFFQFEQPETRPSSELMIGQRFPKSISATSAVHLARTP
jgi:competence protein ComEA